MTVVDDAADGLGRVRNPGAIVFCGVLTAYAALIVFSALALKPGPRLVPLVIGIPTLVGMMTVTVREVIGHRIEVEDVTEIVDGPADIRTARLGTLAGMAGKEIAEDNVLSTDPESVRKRRMFVLWAVGVFLVAWLTNFYVAMAVGLLSIYRYARIGWLKSTLITGGLVGIIYATFDLLLGVRF